MQTGKLWNDEETTILCQMKAGNKDDRQIADALGRTVYGIKERWRWIHLTEEQKQDRRTKINANRFGMRKSDATRKIRCASSIFSRTIPDGVLIDRDKRMLAPRSLGCELMGDPPPGYSALDRKRQEASA